MAGKLSALKIKNLTEPGRYGDGGGLWLQVRDAEHRSWLFRYMRHGKARHMGLGALELVPLKEAREAALEARRMLLRGEDPLEKKQAAKAASAQLLALTFREVSERYVAAHEASWRSDKHRQQWRSSVERYVYPAFGAQSVSSIDTGAVMRILEPIWRDWPETASRVRGRIEAVLDYAAARGWRTGENPARWRGHLQNLLPARSKLAPVEHYAALPYAELPPLMARIRSDDTMAARMLAFAILTAARSGEVREATWSEIDLDAKVWIIPGARMKAGREHRIPLSGAALAVLEQVRHLRDRGDLVFPGRGRGKPLSKTALTSVLERLGQKGVTAHGFRSTFRDWTAETTSTPREVAEAALAHTVGNKVEAAYRRGDLFAKRRELMEAWAGWCRSA